MLEQMGFYSDTLIDSYAVNSLLIAHKCGIKQKGKSYSI